MRMDAFCSRTRTFATRFTDMNDTYSRVVCRLRFQFAGSSLYEVRKEDAKGVALPTSIRDVMRTIAGMSG
jgi:hypothetical protein